MKQISTTSDGGMGYQPMVLYCGTLAGIPVNQQERPDLFLATQKIASLLLIRPEYGPTPWRTTPMGW